MHLSLPALGLVLIGGVAHADRGALSADASIGATAIGVPAPYVAPDRSTAGTGLRTALGARYALSNSFEVTSAAFFEPPATYFHNGVNVVTADGTFPGTLSHRVSRFGLLVGARFIKGSVWRLTAGVDLGWSQQVSSALRHIDDASPDNPFDYGLSLADVSVASLVAAPVAGIEWAGGDHWSISVLPRIEFLIGSRTTWAVSVPVGFSWSWYL